MFLGLTSALPAASNVTSSISFTVELMIPFSSLDAEPNILGN